jgi:phosphatidylglycerophosphatase A
LIDRYWKNAVGVILDDVIAGVYAGAVFYVLR